MSFAIIDRGRGPEIAGSRITVYDVLAATQAGMTPEQLARDWNLDIGQIELALQYIEQHHDEVMEDYRQIKERHARGNTPEIQAKVDATHAKYAPMWAELHRRFQECQQKDYRGPNFAQVSAEVRSRYLPAKERRNGRSPGGQ
jgi:uncharacterized protein (DUF433 family)